MRWGKKRNSRVFVYSLWVFFTFPPKTLVFFRYVVRGISCCRGLSNAIGCMKNSAKDDDERDTAIAVLSSEKKLDKREVCS